MPQLSPSRNKEVGISTSAASNLEDKRARYGSNLEQIWDAILFQHSQVCIIKVVQLRFQNHLNITYAKTSTKKSDVPFVLADPNRKDSGQRENILPAP